MAEPYVAVIELPGGELITSVIVDQPEFDATVDELLGVLSIGQEGARLDAERAGELKRNGNVPLIKRGTLTESAFRRFGVRTDLMCMAVRGFAARFQ